MESSSPNVERSSPLSRSRAGKEPLFPRSPSALAVIGSESFCPKAAGSIAM
jgi:hypothetical protein